MPIRLCVTPGCPNVAVTRGRCRDHSSRPPRGPRIYDRKRWTILRRAVLYEESLCRACLAQGKETIATLVDHMIPLEDGGAPWDRDNLQPLCHEHHSVKTAEEHLSRARQG